MSTDGLERTLQTLRNSSNPHATDVLLTAFRSGVPELTRLAAESLLDRSSPRGQIAVLRSLGELDESLHQKVALMSRRLVQAFRDGLLHGDGLQQRSLLEVIRATDNFHQLPSVIDLLSHPAACEPEFIAETIRWLHHRLYDLTHAADHDDPASDAVRQHAVNERPTILAALGPAVSKLQDGPHLDVIIEGILLLAHPGEQLYQQTLWHGSPAVRESVHRLLMGGTHHGILQLIWQLCDLQYPHPRALEALQNRHDPQLVQFVLSSTRQRIGELLRQTLRQIDHLAWLRPDLGGAEIPPALHLQAVDLLRLLAFPREHQRQILEWFLRHGSPMARSAAGELLAAVDSSLVKEVVFESLESPAAEVQAWACHQLRYQPSDEAIPRLMKRVDSPLDPVREAAREELLEVFGIDRLMESVDTLSPTVGRRIGELLLKIESRSPARLQEYFQTKLFQPRLQALKLVEKLCWAPQMMEVLVSLADDQELMLRRMAIELLALVPDRVASLTLTRCLRDGSPRVRDAASNSLKMWHQRTIEGDEPALADTVEPFVTEEMLEATP
jgi:hypothetical protein